MHFAFTKAVQRCCAAGHSACRVHQASCSACRPAPLSLCKSLFRQGLVQCFSEAAALHSHLRSVYQLQPALSWHLEVCGPVLVPKGMPAEDMHLVLWLHLARCVCL